jgi:hypothetical protein
VFRFGSKFEVRSSGFGVRRSDCGAETYCVDELGTNLNTNREVRTGKRELEQALAVTI